MYLYLHVQGEEGGESADLRVRDDGTTMEELEVCVCARVCNSNL